MREIWIDTWRSIVAHRVRFGLTALGIAWGAFMLTFLSSSMQGFEQHFVSEFEEIGPKIVFMGRGWISAKCHSWPGFPSCCCFIIETTRASSLSARESTPAFFMPATE